MRAARPALEPRALGLALLPEGPYALCTRSFSSFLYCVRRLSYNKLGPKGGKALAEALKSNTTLKILRSAARPSNPPTHAF